MANLPTDERSAALADVRRMLDEAEHLDRYGRHAEAMALAESARAQALAWSALALAAEAGLRITRVTSTHSLAEAVRLAERTIQEAIQAADVTTEARTRALQAAMLAGLGELERAVEEGRRAVRLAPLTGQPVIAARASIGLANAYGRLGQIDDACRACDHAIDMARQAGDELQVAVCIGQYGLLHDRAAGELEQVGEMAAAQGHYRRAASLLAESIANGEMRKSPAFFAQNRLNLAYAMVKLGECEGIETLVADAMASLTAEPDLRTESLALRVLGEMHLMQDRPHEARAAIERSIALSMHMNEREYTLTSLLPMSRACEAAGDLRAALDYAYQHHEMYAEMKTREAERRARAVALQFETEKAHAQAEIERARANALLAANRDLEARNQHLARASQLDPLTGLYNRRRLDAVARNLSRRAKRRPFCVVLADIDHFKRINDTFSHLVGDEVLRRLGAIVQASCRREDVPVRLGGEEIALMLYGLKRAQALEVCERLRESVERHGWHVIHPDLCVTISVGVADNGEASALPELLAIADERLYAAKAAGRNRVEAGAWQ